MAATELANALDEASTKGTRAMAALPKSVRCSALPRYEVATAPSVNAGRAALRKGPPVDWMRSNGSTPAADALPPGTIERHTDVHASRMPSGISDPSPNASRMRSLSPSRPEHTVGTSLWKTIARKAMGMTSGAPAQSARERLDGSPACQPPAQSARNETSSAPVAGPFALATAARPPLSSSHATAAVNAAGARSLPKSSASLTSYATITVYVSTRYSPVVSAAPVGPSVSPAIAVSVTVSVLPLRSMRATLTSVSSSASA
mmetsp:Transcript_4985/g.19881  ORF Transcript_4985/g.19881 Transcript_4985/m.19881 type:complete len:261 (+) Transcript_4985:646-1428(+)